MVHCRPQAFCTEFSEKIFPAEWYYVTKLGPQVSPFPVPIFGVNRHLPRKVSRTNSSAKIHELQLGMDSLVVPLLSGIRKDGSRLPHLTSLHKVQSSFSGNCTGTP
jgi:hypothetical protein